MVNKKISLLEFENNSNIGLYMFVNDKFCLLGKEIDDKKKDDIEKILGVPIYITPILNTELVGIFISGNNDKLFIPELLDFEKSKLEIIAKKHEVEIIELKEKINTYGNNMCVGNEEILISDEYNNNFVEFLKRKSKMSIIKVGTDEYKATGALCRFMDNKYFVSQELNEGNFKKIINKISGVGTINSGSNFISSGVVGNKNGILLGTLSSTIEIQNIVEAFDSDINK